MFDKDRLLIIFIAVTILEALLFATPQFGWSSYVYVLIDKGFYSEKCNSDVSRNTDCNSSSTNFSDGSVVYNNCTLTNTQKIQVSNGRSVHQCKPQQESLNFLYTIAIAAIFGCVAVWGILVVKFGFVPVKILSMIFGISGNVMLAFTSPDNVWIITPGMFCIGFAGQGLVMVNMKITSYIPFGIGLYSAFLMGAANSSVLSFLIVKVFVFESQTCPIPQTSMTDQLQKQMQEPDANSTNRYAFIGFAVLYAVLGGTSAFFHKMFQKKETLHMYNKEIHVATSCDTIITMSSDDVVTTLEIHNIPDPFSSNDTNKCNKGIHVIDLNFPREVTDKIYTKPEIQFEFEVATGNNTNETLTRHENNVNQLKLKIPDKNFTEPAGLHSDPDKQTLRQSVFQTVTLTFYIWYAIVLMSLFTYIGMINDRLEQDFSDKVSYFTNILGNILLAAIVLAFIPGGVAECQQKICTGHGSLKETKLKQQVLSLTLSTLIGVTLHGLTIIKSEVSLYVEFLLLILLRLFFHSSLLTFLVATYPIRHSGFIYGLGGTIAGIVSSLQYVFFRWYNAYPGSHLHKLQVIYSYGKTGEAEETSKQSLELQHERHELLTKSGVRSGAPEE